MGWCGKCKKRRIRLRGQGGCDRRIEGDACCGRGGGQVGCEPKNLKLL